MELDSMQRSSSTERLHRLLSLTRLDQPPEESIALPRARNSGSSSFLSSLLRALSSWGSTSGTLNELLAQAGAELSAEGRAAAERQVARPPSSGPAGTPASSLPRYAPRGTGMQRAPEGSTFQEAPQKPRRVHAAQRADNAVQQKILSSTDQGGARPAKRQRQLDKDAEQGLTAAKRTRWATPMQHPAPSGLHSSSGGLRNKDSAQAVARWLMVRSPIARQTQPVRGPSSQSRSPSPATSPASSDSHIVKAAAHPAPKSAFKGVSCHKCVPHSSFELL